MHACTHTQIGAPSNGIAKVFHGLWDSPWLTECEHHPNQFSIMDIALPLGHVPPPPSHAGCDPDSILVYTCSRMGRCLGTPLHQPVWDPPGAPVSAVHSLRQRNNVESMRTGALDCALTQSVMVVPQSSPPSSKRTILT